MERTQRLLADILNNIICLDCGKEYTHEGEWIMDTFACPYDEGYCVNCCECEEHEGEKWYDN
jgi:hypothetical protein